MEENQGREGVEEREEGGDKRSERRMGGGAHKKGEGERKGDFGEEGESLSLGEMERPFSGFLLFSCVK